MGSMSALDDLRRTVARLRAPDGCPWDREQTHQTLTRCLIDECSELLDAIDRLDLPHMREELGDVLVQIVFHAQLAAERGEFDFDDVAREINEKLVRRHPHVFGPKTCGWRRTSFSLISRATSSKVKSPRSAASCA